MRLEVRVDREFDRVSGEIDCNRSRFSISEDTYNSLHRMSGEFVDIVRITLYDEIHRVHSREEVTVSRVNGKPVVEVPKLAHDSYKYGL